MGGKEAEEVPGGRKVRVRAQLGKEIFYMLRSSNSLCCCYGWWNDNDSGYNGILCFSNLISEYVEACMQVYPQSRIYPLVDMLIIVDVAEHHLFTHLNYFSEKKYICFNLVIILISTATVLR